MTVVQSACSQAHIVLEHAAALDAFLDMAVKREAPIASQLVVLLDYDLTLSASSVAECHHMLRDSSALPAGFRQAVQALFDARDPMHPQHTSIYGSDSDADRPHRFWMTYNHLLVEYRITQRMIDQAVAEEKRRQREVHGRKTLLREGVGDLLALCDEARIPVLILSAGLEQVIRSVFAADGVPIPTSCEVLTNRLVLDEVTGECVAVEPADPPASREGKLRLLGGLQHLAQRSMVLMVGDKPVDARVARGLPPVESELAVSNVGDGGAPPTCAGRRELAFGFLNERPPEHTDPHQKAADPTEWQAAFHLLAHRGEACTFAPVEALVRHLLSVAGSSRSGPSLLQLASSRAEAARREPSLRELNQLFTAEGMAAIGDATYAAFVAWARANDVAMDDESFCDFCVATSSTGSDDATFDRAVHRVLDDRHRH